MFLSLKIRKEKLYVAYPSTNIDWDADHHGREYDASRQADTDWCTNERSHLPHDFLLATPWLLSPECAARWALGKKKMRLMKVKIKYNRKSLFSRANALPLGTWNKVV